EPVSSILRSADGRCQHAPRDFLQSHAEGVIAEGVGSADLVLAVGVFGDFWHDLWSLVMRDHIQLHLDRDIVERRAMSLLCPEDGSRGLAAVHYLKVPSEYDL